MAAAPPKPRKTTNVLGVQAELAPYSPAPRYDRTSFFKYFYSEPAISEPDPIEFNVPPSIPPSNTMERARKRNNENKIIYTARSMASYPSSTCISIPFVEMERDMTEVFWRFVVELNLTDGTVISTKHRYSEFYELHKRWTQKHSTLENTGIEFPKRMVTVSDTDLAQRAYDLETYLRKICAINAVIPDVARFLKCDEKELKATLKESSEMIQQAPIMPRSNPQNDMSQYDAMGMNSSFGYGGFHNAIPMQPMYGHSPLGPAPMQYEMMPMIGGSEPAFQESKQPAYAQKRMTWFYPSFFGFQGQFPPDPSMGDPFAPPPKSKMSFTMPSMRLRMPRVSLMPLRRTPPPLPPRPEKKKNRLATKEASSKTLPKSFGSSIKDPASKQATEPKRKADGSKDTKRAHHSAPPARPSAVGVDVKNRIKMFERA